MADILLSYANEDREAARAVAGLLESAGCTVWWDRRIPAAHTWRSMIEEALRDMRCIVVTRWRATGSKKKPGYDAEHAQHYYRAC